MPARGEVCAMRSGQTVGSHGDTKHIVATAPRSASYLHPGTRVAIDLGEHEALVATVIPTKPCEHARIAVGSERQLAAYCDAIFRPSWRVIGNDVGSGPSGEGFEVATAYRPIRA